MRGPLGGIVAAPQPKVTLPANQTFNGKYLTNLSGTNNLSVVGSGPAIGTNQTLVILFYWAPGVSAINNVQGVWENLNLGALLGWTLQWAHTGGPVADNMSF